MFCLWMFLLILGYAAASPVNVPEIRAGLLSDDVAVRNSALEELLLGLLEELRETMVTGSDDLPVLDPLEVENIHLDEEILPFPGAHVKVNDLKLSRLSNFVVANLSVNSVSVLLQRYRLTFDFYVPMLKAEADKYDLLVSAAGTNIFGNGDAKINLTEPRVRGSLLVAPRISISGLFLNILDSNVSFDLKGFDSRINGLLNDESLSGFINSFLKHFVPEVVELYEAEITEFLSELVQDVGNDLLRDLNLIDILG